MNETNSFELPLSEFDLSLLPAHARNTTSEAFRDALNEFVSRELKGFAKQIDVVVSPSHLQVRWSGVNSKEVPLESALQHLRVGNLQQGIQTLKLLLKAKPEDGLVLYNLGMALSEVGKLDEAVLYLQRAVELDPSEPNRKVALAVALLRSGEFSQAETLLRQSVEQEPENPYALRNLAGCLLAQHKDLAGAEALLRKTTSLTPADQQAWLGLGQVCHSLGNIPDADEAFKRVLEINDRSTFAEQARRARSQIAQQEMRSAVGGTIRPDAVSYCLAALQKFGQMTPAQVKQVAFEIAALGTKGLNPNDPSREYSLKSLPGSFTAMRLLCYMFVAFKQIAPQHDIGFDLRREFEIATQMNSGRG